jgi:hypothetical protein
MALNNNEEGFNPLDTLGPAVGSINSLNPDAKNYTPFEGDPIDFGKANPPALENPLVPKGLVNQSKNVRKYIVGTPPKKGGIAYNSKGIDPKQKISLIKNYLTSLSKSHAQKGSTAKLYSYNAGSSGNAHFKRYYAYGAETFDKIGFNPMKDNESTFNENTSAWQDFGRQLTHSFVPLFTRGFVAGPKSLLKMIHGDFTSGDLDDAREYEEAAAIGTSTKTGLVPFLSNTFMNFGYTAGTMAEIVTEEIAAGILAPVTGGLSFLGATKNSISNVYKAAKGIKFAKNAENTVQTVQSLNNLKNANSFWKDANYLLDTPVGSFLNPVNNARRSFQNAKASNLTNLATAFRTAGGFYQDVRSINAAISESRLEAGMVQDKVYNNKYDQFYLRNKRAPTNEEQEDMTKVSVKSGLETFYKNAGLIYGTNKITFGNILNKGGIKNYFKNATQDIMNVSHKSFGTIGKVLYDKTAKKFLYESSVGYQGFKNLAKSWMKQPLSKSVLGSVKYFKSNFSEGFQENAQEIIARANEKWYTDSYNSPYLKASLFNNAVNSINLKNNSGTPLSIYNEELNKEFSAQGFETFASGFFMGTLGGGMNKTFSLLQNAYGRIFDKAGYKAWTEQKEAVTNTLVNELNKIDINDLLSNRYVNAGSQDTLSLIKEQANTKESKDAELDSLINQVSTMIKTGSSEIFQDKLKSLREVSDEALQEELKFDNIKDAERYRLKIDKTISKIDSIKEAYETISENFPNPINNDNMPDRSDPNYVEAAALRNGWDVAVKNIVYANEAFKDVANRISSIKQTYLKNSTLKNVSSSKISPLFQVKLLADSINSFELELDMLKKGVKSKTSTTIESDKIKINDLEEEILNLKEFKVSYDAFNKFTNRSEYTKEVQEELQQDTEQDVTAEDVEEKMSKLYGKEDDEEKMVELLSNLKKSHDSYLRTLAKAQDTNIFSTELDDAFVQLVDFYKLNKDSRNLASHIELLSDPENFYGLVRKNTEWSKRLYKNRKKYFRDLVKQEIANIESNALLNAMADEGLYMSANDYSDWQTLRTRPSEFFNSIDGEVYKIDTVKYNEIYDKYLSKDKDLKAKSKFSEVSNVIADYTEELVKLEEKKQNEIDLLEKTVTQVPEKSIELKGNAKSISIKNVDEILNNNSYIELTPKNSETTIILYKDEQGVLRYNDETGDVYDLNDKTRFTENKVYSEKLIPDPIKVTEIENRYAKEKLDIIENFKTSRSLTDLEFEDPYIIGESDFKSMSDGLKDKLYKDFQTTLPNKTTEDKINAPDDSSKAFQDWVNTDASAKTIIDEFNKDIELISEFTFQNNDKTVNTNDLSTNQIIDVVNEKSKELNKLKEELSKLKEDDPNYNIKKLEIETLSEETKKLLKVNKSRSLQERTTPQKKVIKEIEKLIELNKAVQKDYVLTEDDPVTGLKKGDKAYLINNLIHRRVTNAIQAYLEKYEYSSYKLLEKSYDDTIRVNGLNEASVDAFIKLLKDGGASGINDKLFTELAKDIKSFITSNVVNNEIESLNEQIKTLKEDIALSKKAKNKDRVKTLNAELKTLTAELAALGTNTKADVDNEELFDKVLNLISEKSYEDGRVAGNYVDLIKDYFQYGKKPVFDEKIISKKAYDELFNDDFGYIVQLDKKFKDEGYYIVGNNLVVWDSNIVTGEGKKDRIAGEIDLIVVDKKGNAFIIDIKTGSKSKWTNFNQPTNSFDNKKYSKRNEYTLQQAVYRELLKRQTGVETAIGLLPIERESDKETDQIISAKKPLAAGLAKEVIYEFDDEGKVKKNKFKDPKGDKDFEEKIFKPGPNNAINDVFIPLSLESVAEEIDDLLAPKDDKGAQSFSFESPDIKLTSQEENLLKTKNAVIINSYIRDLENSQESLNKLENILKSITIPDISNITIGNAFIADRLKISEEGDNKFKNYYDKHKSFEESTKPPHENQLMAAKILNATKIITDVEYQSIESQDLNMAEVSELIHNAVIRIEYLIANDTSNAQEFKVYQKTLFSYMGQSSFHMNLQDTVNVLGNLNKENYNSLLTNEILKLTNKLQYAKIDFQKKNIERSIEKLTNLKDNLLSLYGEVKEEFVSPIEVNSRYFKNNKDYTQITVMKVDGDKITIKGNRKNSKETIVSTKDLLNKELYLTSEDIDKLKSEESNYEANESEKIILKEVQNTTETFINSKDDKNKAAEIGLKDTIENIETDLLTEIKNCQ